MHRSTLALLLILASAPVAAEVERSLDPALLIGLGNVRYHRLDSTALERSFHIFVRLPEGYDESSEKLATVYLLDGGITFPLLGSYYRYLSLGGAVPGSIIVGISYGTDDWRQGNMRSTDFTAPSAEREFWGGAGRFQRVLEKELLPLIESTYRADPRRRIIFGQSLGGQFVLFSAQTRPELFWGHIASNPALDRNLSFFLKTRPGDATETRSSLFVSSGSEDEDRFRLPALRWIEYWTGQDSVPWRLETRTLDDQSHFSAAPEAFRQGMIWLFKGE